MASRGKYRPNIILRRLREERGWSLRRVADELCLLAAAEDESRMPGVNANMVGVWERGWKRPSPFYQAIFCQLYHRSASQLGFVHEDAPPPAPTKEMHQEVTSPTHTITHFPQLALALEQTHAIDLLFHTGETTTEQKARAWLTLGASGVGQLFDEGWTLDEILASLQVILQSVQAMPSITRRQLLHLGAAAAINSMPIPSSNVSVEERVKLCSALGESIATGWKLFVTASMPQVLAIGQAQLQMLHVSYAEIYPGVRPLFYSPVYRLIGAALFFQSRYGEALQTHKQAYLTALEAGDSWNMAESLSWQAGIFKACGRHDESIQMTEAALRLLHGSKGPHIVASQARLLAHRAESAALMGERSVMEERLAASAELLTQFEGDIEFDAAIWQLYRGTCTLYIGDAATADQYLEQALRELKPNLLHQRAAATLLQAQARLKMRDWKRSLNAVHTAVPLVLAATSPLLDRGLVDLIEQFMPALPRDDEVRTLIEEVQQNPRWHKMQTQQRVPRYLESTLV